MFNAQQPFVDTANDMTPINDMKVVTPSDTVDLPSGPCRALIFTGAGNITLITAQGSSITIAISASWFGIQYMRAKRVMATGTTISAGNIIACY